MHKKRREGGGENEGENEGGRGLKTGRKVWTSFMDDPLIK